MSAQRLGLAVVLGATLLAAYLAPESADVVAPADKRVDVGKAARPADARRGVREPDAVLLIRARQEDADFPAIFNTEPVPDLVAMAPPPPQVVAVAPPPPPPPQAPPLPFKAFGRYVDNGKAAVFMKVNEQNLVVRAGDRIDSQYLVESIDATAVTLLYEPLNQRQTLSIGSDQ